MLSEEAVTVPKKRKRHHKRCPVCREVILHGNRRCVRCGWIPWYCHPMIIMAAVILLGLVLAYYVLQTPS